MLSYEWSLTRNLATDKKVRTTLYSVITVPHESTDHKWFIPNGFNHLELERCTIGCTVVRDKAHEDELSKALAKLTFQQTLCS